jgi:hypothetical protein
VLLDTHRLWPLALVVAVGAAFDTLHGGAAAAALAAGGGSGPGALAAAAAPALLKWAAGVGTLVGAAHVAARRAIGGRVFTGTKWTVASLFGRSSSDAGGSSGDAGGSNGDAGGSSDASEQAAARAAAARFVRATAALLGTPPAHLEPPTVTRYQSGQQQRVHFDGRPAGDPSGLAEFMAAGGQRLVQARGGGRRAGCGGERPQGAAACLSTPSCLTPARSPTPPPLHSPRSCAT